MPSLPYEKLFKFEAVLGEDNWFTLKVPPRAEIRKLLVRQEDGALGGYTVDIYNKFTVLPGSSSSSVPGSDEEVFSPELHKVLPTQTVANGIAELEAFFPQGGYIYENLDSPKRTNHEYKLYMKITPTGAGPGEFHVGLGLTLPNI